MKTLGTFALLLTILLLTSSSGPQNLSDPLMNDQDRIIYVGDPMCSWCWGISQELTKFAEAHAAAYPLLVVAGGLRPGTTEPMDEELANFLEHHWQDVNRASGQPFSYGILKDRTFVYDTEVPCRAVVTVRELAPEKAFGFFKAIQENFYVNNQNTNETASYLPICDQFGIDRTAFQKSFESPEMRQRTQADFALSSRLGVRGFPAVLLQTGGEVRLLANGFAPFAQLEKAFEQAVATTKTK